MNTHLPKTTFAGSVIPQRKIEEYADIFKPYKLPKGRILVDYGEVSTRLYIIQKGVIRAYYMRKQEQVTSWIQAEGEVVCATESFFTQTPSTEVLETLEETTLYSVSFAQYSSFIQSDHEMAGVAIRLLQQSLVANDKRVRMLRFLSVKERIQYFTTHHASLFRRVPDRMVASYLGISQAAFSRNLSKD